MRAGAAGEQAQSLLVIEVTGASARGSIPDQTPSPPSQRSEEGPVVLGPPPLPIDYLHADTLAAGRVRVVMRVFCAAVSLGGAALLVYMMAPDVLHGGPCVLAPAIVSPHGVSTRPCPAGERNCESIGMLVTSVASLQPGHRFLIRQAFECGGSAKPCRATTEPFMRTRARHMFACFKINGCGACPYRHVSPQPPDAPTMTPTRVACVVAITTAILMGFVVCLVSVRSSAAPHLVPFV